MKHITIFFIRRMRLPLMVLLMAYTISITGMVLIPGVEVDGETWRMGFFHAIYFVSFLATTIGLGEIPHPLSDAQRLWVIVSIYISVIAWLYAIGFILSLLQDPKFRRALVRSRFKETVVTMSEQMDKPFYIVCGYGSVGSSLVEMLTEQHIPVVVIDDSQECIDALDMEEYELDVPALCANACDTEVLIDAGLLHSGKGRKQQGGCAGVIALTSSDEVNLKVSIASKILRPDLPVISRAEDVVVEQSMELFGVDHIMDPVDTFANLLALVLYAPPLHLLRDWLTGDPGSDLTDPMYPPNGRWILCGYGRFGREVHERLLKGEQEVTVVEMEPQDVPDNVSLICGAATDLAALNDARIQDADGIVIGTNNDEMNLTIIRAAYLLNPGIFVIVRQNNKDSSRLFANEAIDLLMETSDIIARRIRMLLSTNLLYEFVQHAQRQDSEWANILISRLCAVMEGDPPHLPHLWSMRVTQEKMPGVHEALSMGRDVHLRDLFQDPIKMATSLSCVPLMLVRGELKFYMPDDSMLIESGDRILFCGSKRIEAIMERSCQDIFSLNHLMREDEMPDGYIWRWIQRTRNDKDRRVNPR
ncbi:MAG: potassium channel protein [Gammaproteobacteria bacterium]|nr:potassium channel protein [Gammaproteobacteria bacterium]